MIYILITIALVSSFFVIFHLFGKHGINSFQAIVFNYVTCTFIGLFSAGDDLSITVDMSGQSWLIWSILAGLFFLINFCLVSLTVRHVSASVAGIANRLSLVIPVVASLWYISDQSFSLPNYFGLILAFLSIVLISVHSRKETTTISQTKSYLLPTALFLFSGATDLVINYSNYRYSNTPGFTYFPVTAFAFAAFSGSLLIIILILTCYQKLSFRSSIAGILLGIPNYYSLIFLLDALDYYSNDGARVFTTVNIGIIMVTSIFAARVLKEKLTMIYWLGMALAGTSLVLIYV